MKMDQQDGCGPVAGRRGKGRCDSLAWSLVADADAKTFAENLKDYLDRSGERELVDFQFRPVAVENEVVYAALVVTGNPVEDD